MKRFLVFVVALLVLVSGGVYFTAETVILPKQEQVWRTLLKDLPYGLEADFEDVEFEFIGLTLSIGGATLSDGKNTIKVSEIVAENSLKTALGNLFRFIVGLEEENYDVVRFIGIEPLELQQGLGLKIQEIRLLDVAIGIDNNLPTTMKTLTGMINLEEAFAAGTVGGFEVHGLNWNIQGMVGVLDWMKVHGITRTNLGLIEVAGMKVVAGAQTLSELEMFRTTNLNIAMAMEPAEVMKLAGKTESGDLSAFNMFHFADELVLVGLGSQVPGIGGLSVKRMMYKEEEVEIVDNAGIVPTRTFSDTRDFNIAFPGLAVLSPEAGLFMQTTGITGLKINGEGDTSWDLVSGVQTSGGWVDFAGLVKFSLDLELGNFQPDDIVAAMAWGLGMTGTTGQTINPAVAEALKVYGDITLIDFDYLIENESLIERLYRFAEAATGMPEADLKAMVDAQLQAAAADPNLPPSLVDDIAALRAFAADPKSLRISLTPPEAVSLNEIMAVEAPMLGAEMIGLTITANEAS